jgi:hypothetical protein
MASARREQFSRHRATLGYWTRRGLAEWLCTELGAYIPTQVGIDPGFSFPIAYFDRHRLPRDWPIEPCHLLHKSLASTEAAPFAA